MQPAFQHVYVHVPFCDGKCAYCGFYSTSYDASLADAYLDALAREFDLLLPSGARPAPQTIYVGGGTPTILPAERLQRLCRIIGNRLDLSQLREWTVEANPGTLPRLKAAALEAAGVNRVSIGVQSLSDPVLSALGRRHAAHHVAPTLSALRAAGIRNIALDLIACLPGVNPRQWQDTLRGCLRLRPRHISVYALTIEPGTALDRSTRAGQVRLPSDRGQLQALAAAQRLLRRRGFRRYEISNYARPGAECLHNLSFWRGGDYIGFGPAAASRIGLRRRTNRPDLSSYIAALRAGRRPPAQRETLTPAQDAAERFAFAFRLREGVDVTDFCARREVPESQRRKWLATLAGLRTHGLACRSGPRWRLSAKGRDLADAVAAELLDVAGQELCRDSNSHPAARH